MTNDKSYKKKKPSNKQKENKEFIIPKEDELLIFLYKNLGKNNKTKTLLKINLLVLMEILLHNIIIL